MALPRRSGAVVNRTVEYRSSRSAGCEDMPRKSVDIKFSDYPVPAEKGATAPFSCLPARMGSGSARKRVKGQVPCGFLGQRPKPSESLSISISAIFKVQSSLIFLARFFITYLTLPRCIFKIRSFEIPDPCLLLQS